MIFSYAKNVIQVELSKMGLPFFFKIRLKYSLVQEKFPPFLSWPMFGVKGHVLNPTHNRLSMKAFLEKRRRFYQRDLLERVSLLVMVLLTKSYLSEAMELNLVSIGTLLLNYFIVHHHSFTSTKPLPDEKTRNYLACQFEDLCSLLRAMLIYQ
ncbi:hypothetical protein OUZ56_014498 [Daphnia magna]|uniref:Uncharacterized protein n=1 Tax=Daphnia magna TaxID=35525 RepID=A0ABR0AJY3_9CRUS|nr:hypothetical protein OUZ56_014498 [Daphnia magna]